MANLHDLRAYHDRAQTALILGGVPAVWRDYKQYCHSEEANLGIVGIVISFIICASLMAFGVYIIYAVTSGTPEIPENNSLHATQAGLLANISSGYGILGLALVIIPMVAIIGLFLMFSGGRK